MPRPLHPGRPTSASAVIPDGWAAAHAPVVAGTFDCTVTIAPPVGGPVAFNPETRQSEAPNPTPVYTGAASITPAGAAAASDGTRTEAASELVDDRTYLVRLDGGDTSAIKPDHVVTVTDSPNPRLVDAVLIVMSTPRPGREFSRNVVARLFE